MGSLLSKRPARVIVPDDELEDGDQTWKDGVDAEKQVGQDALGVPEVEKSYPDAEPPDEELTIRLTDDGGVKGETTLSSTVGGESGLSHQHVTQHLKASSTPVETRRMVANGGLGSTVKHSKFGLGNGTFDVSRSPMSNARPDTSTNFTRRPVKPGYPISGWPTPAMVTKSGMPPTFSTIQRGHAVKSLHGSLDNLLSSSSGTDGYGGKTLTQREFLLLRREWFAAQSAADTKSEGRLGRGQFVSRSEMSFPEVLYDAPPLKSIDFSSADRKAEELKDHRANSYKSLIRDLTSGLQEDSLKVWAILSWISKQGIGKIQFQAKMPKPDTPNGYMKMMQEGQGTYPAFFALLCRKAGIKCAIITGISKSAEYEAGDQDVDGLRNTWNAVFIEGGWRLVHPLWVCRSLKGHQAGGWMTIEKEGKTLTQVHKADRGVAVSTYNSYYIFTDPKEFIYRNFPDEEKWQLLEKPYTKEDFVAMPYFRPEFFKNGFKLFSEEKCVLVSEDGTQKDIAIGFPFQSGLDLVFIYELSLKVDEDETGDEAVGNITPDVGRYVLVLKSEDMVTFEIRFPMKGSYKLRISGGLYSQYGGRPPWLTDIRLDCLEDPAKSNPLPFDPGVVGWGPGPIAESLGLFVPSHEEAVIEVAEGENTVIQFILLRRIRVSVELSHCSLDAGDLTDLVSHEIIEENETLELRVVVQYPGRQETEFALKLDVLNKETHKLENACNYIMYTNRDVEHEGYYERKSRKMVSDAMLSNDVTAMEEAIESCTKYGLPDVDPEVRGGIIRLEYLQVKRDLQYSLQVNRIEVSRHSVRRAKGARFRPLVARDLKKAEAHLADLEELDAGGWSYRVPEIDRSVLMEMGHMRNPREEVRQILVAMALLLGMKEEETEDWKRMQQLLRKEESTLVAMAKLERDLNVPDAQITSLDDVAFQKVEDIMEAYSEEQIRRMNNTAAAFYQWVSSAVTLLRGRELPVRPKEEVAKPPSKPINALTIYRRGNQPKFKQTTASPSVDQAGIDKDRTTKSTQSKVPPLSNRSTVTATDQRNKSKLRPDEVTDMNGRSLLGKRSAAQSHLKPDIATDIGGRSLPMRSNRGAAPSLTEDSVVDERNLAARSRFSAAPSLTQDSVVDERNLAARSGYSAAPSLTQDSLTEGIHGRDVATKPKRTATPWSVRPGSVTGNGKQSLPFKFKQSATPSSLDPDIVREVTGRDGAPRTKHSALDTSLVADSDY